MKTIIDLTLVALVTIYIVDLSGFTDTWLEFLSAYQERKITELKPFSCSLCMVWWVCLIYAFVTGCLSLPIVAFIAFLSLFSVQFGQVLMLVREAVSALINKIGDLL